MSELITSNPLYISVLDDKANQEYYYLVFNSKSILKFYTSEKTLEYSPKQLDFRLVQQKAGAERNVLGATIEVTITKSNILTGENSIEEKLAPFVQQNDSTGQFIPQIYYLPELIDMTPDDTNDNNFSQPINITNIKIEAKYQGRTVAYENLPVLYGTDEQMAKFALKANGIYAAVQDAKFTFSQTGLLIQNGGIIIQDKYNNNVFRADTDGNLYYKGEIISDKGEVSGWDIQPYELIDKDKNVGIHSGKERYYLDDSSPIRFWAKKPINEDGVSLLTDTTNYSFAVTQNGTLYANDAHIIGDIFATSGHILNRFYIGPNNETGIIIEGAENNSYIGSMGYASGALGGGWIIRADGSAEFNNVSVRGKITSSVFEYDHISSIGGSLYVAPTVYTLKKSSLIKQVGTNLYEVTWELDTNLDMAFGDNEIYDDFCFLLDGDIILSNIIKHISNIQAVTYGIGEQKSNTLYSLTLRFNYEDASIQNCVFEPGVAIVFYGTKNTREGLYLTAMGQNTPYLDIYSHTAEEENPIPAVRLGNLKGITDATFMESFSGYGLYSSNAYLRGQLMLPNAGVTNQTSILKYDETTDTSSAVRIWAGRKGNTIADSNFVVTEDGSLYASKGMFQGIVKAVDSEFSGSIRAAGILLEQEDLQSGDTLHDHFFITRVIIQQVEDLKKQIKTEEDYTIFKNKNDTDKLNLIQNCGFTPEQATEILQASSENVSYEGFLNYLNSWTKRNFVPSYQNYILNIDQYGLSIWEGGLQAYSDLANGKNWTGSIKHFKPYAYNEDTSEAYPFLYLVDAGSETELLSRLVTNKIHVLNFTPIITESGSYYSFTSTQINNGVWFHEVIQQPIGIESCKSIETNIFNKKHTGISLNNSILSIQSSQNEGSIQLNSNSGVFITSNKNDLLNKDNNALFIRGNIQIVNDNNNKSELKLGAAVVQEVKNTSGATIGLNFIAMS